MALYSLVLYSVFALSSACKDDSYDELWQAYKVKYRKNYLIQDERPRRIIWEQNVKQITKHNLEAEFALHSYALELNKFADMFESELDVFRNCFHANEYANSYIPKQYYCDHKCLQSLPESVDWRRKNFVTPVKDQGDCGSCWAFSATGALEGQTKAKSGYLVSLSEQNLIDCSWKEGNHGCNGGWMDYAFKYVIQNQGIDTNISYPYTGKEGVCRFERSGVGANCSDYVKIKFGSEKSLQAAVANKGPISVAISVSGHDFMYYKSGIFYDNICSRTELNHAVLVVGYGSTNGTDYWIVKNSWGTLWGLDGYILMARNVHNMCGIASHAVFPMV